MVHFLFFP